MLGRSSTRPRSTSIHLKHTPIYLYLFICIHMYIYIFKHMLLFFRRPSVIWARLQFDVGDKLYTSTIDYNVSHIHLCNIYAYSFFVMYALLFYTPFGNLGAASIWRWGQTLHVHNRRQFITHLPIQHVCIFIYLCMPVIFFHALR